MNRMNFLKWTTTSDYYSYVLAPNQCRLWGVDLRHKGTITNTANPKGKAGKLLSLHEWRRDFAEGNKRWRFRKFGANHKNSAFHDAYGFIAALKKRGFKPLGEGAFATVLGKDGYDRVLKVNRRPDVWIDYAVWAAKAGEAGKYAPKVHSYKTIKGKRGDFSVAVVERIDYTVSDTPSDHAMKILPDLLYFAKDNPIAARFVDVLAPNLNKFVEKVRVEFDDKRLDLHGENMMVRKDGSFVITDPVAGENTGKYKRLKAGDFTPAVSLLLAA